MLRPEHLRDLLWKNSCAESFIIVWCVLFVCVYVCVRDMYIQRCRHAPEHTHIHILMQTLHVYGGLKHHGV